jgi:hypothetical protein
MRETTGILNYENIISEPVGAQVAARCLIDSDLINQFRRARTIYTEDLDGYASPPGLDRWR